MSESKEELPCSYHYTPTCPFCGLIGDMKKSKLKDALFILKEKRVDSEAVLDFMAFYRKRGKDFKNGHSIVDAFLREGA